MINGEAKQRGQYIMKHYETLLKLDGRWPWVILKSLYKNVSRSSAQSSEREILKGNVLH